VSERSIHRRGAARANGNANANANADANANARQPGPCRRAMIRSVAPEPNLIDP